AIMDGIALMPDEGTWYESLGDYYVSITDPDLSLATEAYLNAYRREPSRALLFKINRVTRTKSEWDYDAMISLFKDSQFRLEDDPITIGLFARSLAGKGAYERASTQLRNEYKAYSDQIKDGTAPEAIITRWYEDLFVVFAQQDGESGETLALELSGSNPDFWNKSGLAQYWSLRGTPTDFSRAVELQRGVVELAREKSPEQLPLALSRLGNYLISNGEAEESLEVFREMLDLQPDNAQALNNYAYILAVNIGKPQEAIEYARQAVLLSPKSPETIDTMATIHEMLGSHEEALSSRLRLYQLNPTDLATILYIADAYDSHMDDPGKSLQFAELAMKIKPEDPRVLDAMGWASYRTGRALEGEDLIRQSIRSKPSARSHVHMAQVFMQKGDLNKAGEQLGLAEDLSPDDETKAEIERLKDDIARS
ncbi:MAG: tetratricopeptide repeat protein, partial [Phycisphaerales bacterium]|nr:tetratricopeptide repeat protein [Phycisphaerales bacterium]